MAVQDEVHCKRIFLKWKISVLLFNGLVTQFVFLLFQYGQLYFY